MKIKVILIFLLMFLASSVITGNIAGASVPVNPSNVYIYSKYVNVTGGKIISSNNINMELVLAEHGNYKGFLHDLYTPGNPLYRHFINSSEFYRMFGPTQSAKRFIENWLIAKGFVIANSPSPFVIKFSGSPSTVYDTFHAMAVIVNGYSTFNKNPEIPVEISQFVSGLIVTGDKSPFVPMNIKPHLAIPSQSRLSSTASYKPTLGIYLSGQYLTKGTFVPPTDLAANYTLTVTPGDTSSTYVPKPPYNVQVLITGPGLSGNVSFNFTSNAPYNISSNSSIINFNYTFLTTTWPNYYYRNLSFPYAGMELNDYFMHINVSSSNELYGNIVAHVLPTISSKQLESAYNLGPLYASNIKGQNTTIGIVDMNDPSENISMILSDLHTFDAAMGLPNPNITFAGGGVKNSFSGQDGWAGETLMDIEWAHSMAPDAKIEVYLAATLTINGDAYFVNQSKVNVISNSWAWGENATASDFVSIGIGTMAYGNVTWQMGAAAGITIDTASGDTGSQAYCFNSTDGVANMTVNFPADEPYGLAVGGTSIKISNSSSWLAEYAWNGTGNSYVNGGQNSEGSGGGFSNIFTVPSWQKGVYGFPSTETHRGIPDISADGITFVAEYQGGEWYPDAGTSLATPLISGIIDLAYQYNGTGKLGFAAPYLYRIAKNPVLYNASFHDIKIGNNIVGGHGYTTGPGWDPVTGLGTPNGAEFVEALANISHNKSFTPLEVTISYGVNTGLSNIYLSANVVGGTRPYNYEWFMNNQKIGGDNPNLNLSLFSSGNYTFYVNVNGVNSSAITININGTSKFTYDVTYMETGLSMNVTWGITLNGITDSSTTSTIIFIEANGTYPYSVLNTTGFMASPSYSNVNVTGSNVTVPISFTTAAPAKYAVTFTESGLPNGTNWNVTLNGTTKSSTTGTITFTEVNGTYSYTVSNVSGYMTSPLSGSVTVKGKNASVPVTFTPVVSPSKYAVTFTESGLPNGTNWSVTLSGKTQSSTTGTVTFTEVNGTYSYTVSNVSGYTVTPLSGSVTVSGKNASVPVTFKSKPTVTVVKYAVTFTESGLPSGTNWS
ncbi:MAG: protease pro-enzyme activation domain-containing protein, partial [Candidatus Thermoplasmatota archaeon]|nr:protease pro-enzyme activation domain-containing protein [Candidatus Thermoplasmatota archaeon]